MADSSGKYNGKTKISKRGVVCSLVIAEGNCTLGFSESKKALPKSLIKGNELKNPETVDLIL